MLDNCYLDFEACQWHFWKCFNIPIPSPEILHSAISSSSFHRLHLDSLRSTNSKMQVINPTRSFFCGGRPWHLGLARVTLILTSKWSYLDNLGEKICSVRLWVMAPCFCCYLGESALLFLIKMMSVTPATSNQNKIWCFYQLLYIFLDTKPDIF